MIFTEFPNQGRACYMKVAAILGVKDEIELLPHCIMQLRSIGVDLIIAVDAGSTDGSLEILLAHQSPDDFWVHQLSGQDPDAGAWSRLYTDLAKASNADWVLFLDADEFWIPAAGTLKDCLAQEDADCLEVLRFNIPLGEAGLMTPGHDLPSGPDGLSLIVDPIPDFQSHLSRFPDTPWIRGVPVPKVIVRPGAIACVNDGGHGVDPISENNFNRRRATCMLIAHVPFSSLSRFERKLANIRDVFAVHDEYFGAHLAWHWRRWLALQDPQSVRREFERQIFNESQLLAYRSSGVIRSAREVFGEWAENAAVPASAGPT